MILDINDPDVWNKWRAHYNELSFDEQVAFANAAEEKYPVQQHHHTSNFFSIFKQHNDSVLEIGGWKGELAASCFKQFKIKSWTNIEICTNAIKNTVPYLTGRPYHVSHPYKFDWFTEKRLNNYDICISAHTIEHFSNDHMLRLIDYIAGIPLVAFEAPIQSDGDDWTDYGGTHMLTMGWRGVNDAMKAHGYAPVKLNDHCYIYTLGDV